MVLVATLAAVAVATAVMIPVLLKMMVGYAVLCVAMLSVALALLYAYFPLVSRTIIMMGGSISPQRCVAFRDLS